MRGEFRISFKGENFRNFDGRCQAAIRNVFRGTKKATIAASEEILANSIKQVPKLTETLKQSAFYEVHRRADTAPTTWAYEATIGYGGNGDPINPISGQPASQYMVVVHEDYTVSHPVGNAKFLENPVREYAAKNFKRTVFTHAKESLADMSD